MKNVVFIDRDGVINVDPIGDYVKTWEDFRFEGGALDALKEIADLGYEIILISNQAGIGDGIYPESSLRDIHQKMLAEFKQKGIKIRSSHFCLHGKNAGCKCRKPEIGLLNEAVKGLDFDRSKTYFIGDKATDMQAGKRFGLRTIMVLTGHGRTDIRAMSAGVLPDYLVESLLQAVPLLKASFPNP